MAGIKSFMCISLRAIMLDYKFHSISLQIIVFPLLLTMKSEALLILLHLLTVHRADSHSYHL